MAVVAKVFGNAAKTAFNKEWDWNSDNIYCALMKNTYTPNQDTDTYWSDVSAQEIAASGPYVANGLLLTGCTITYDSSTNTVKLDANDAVWTGASITASFAVILDRTPSTDATRPLIAYVDFGASMAQANFTIIWDSLGIVNAVAA